MKLVGITAAQIIDEIDAKVDISPLLIVYTVTR
jgi:hypothetical protein